jgi:hypothetical protein
MMDILDKQMDDFFKLEENKDLQDVKAQLINGEVIPNMIVKQTANIIYLFNIDLSKRNTIEDIDKLSRIKERELKNLILLKELGDDKP